MKPGMASLPCRSIDLRVRPDHRLDFGRGSERLDPVLADGNRLRLRPRIVHRDDPAVGQHEVRRRRHRRPALCARVDGEAAERQDEDEEGALAHDGDYSCGRDITNASDTWLHGCVWFPCDL